MSSQQGARKKEGADAGRAWVKAASFQAVCDLASVNFEYGRTLSELTEMDVPTSEDRDFSWGFLKAVKAKVASAVWTHRP